MLLLQVLLHIAIITDLILLWDAKAFYNFDELNEVTYDITIDDVLHEFESLQIDDDVDSAHNIVRADMENADDGNSQVIANEYGKQFLCRLPKFFASNRTNGDTVAKQNLTKYVVAEIAAAAFYVSDCLQRNFGWWTYEVCFGKDVRQFHGNGSESDSSVLVLGFFNGNDTFVDDRKGGSYYQQFFANGSICDLTKQPRKAYVKYVCEEKLDTHEAFISEVEELLSCEYALTVKTGSLCKLQAFNSTSDRRSSLSVTCRPRLDTNEAKKYLQAKRDKFKNKERFNDEIHKLIVEANSIQRQRIARKRLSIKYLPTAETEAAVLQRLRNEYKAKIKKAAALRAKFSANDLRLSLHAVADDLGLFEKHYDTDEDEDRANIYWYFMDRYWDRSFFPVRVSYARPRRNFNVLLQNATTLSFVSKYTNEKMDGFNLFLSDIDVGVCTEEQLQQLIGPLDQAFLEHLLPTFLEIDKPSTYSSNMSSFWHNHTVQRKLLAEFEKNIMESNLAQTFASSDDTLSNIARHLLQMKASLDAKNSADDAFFTYMKLNELYSMFLRSFNRGIKMSDLKVQHNMDFSDWTYNIETVDQHPITSMLPENAKMIRVNEDIVSLFHEFVRTLVPVAKSDHGTQQETNHHQYHDKSVSNELKNIGNIESFAKYRMTLLAKRKNLRKKVEVFLSRENLEINNESSFDLNKLIERLSADFSTKFAGKYADINFRVVTIPKDVNFENLKQFKKGDQLLFAMIEHKFEEIDYLRSEAEKYRSDLMKGYHFGISMDNSIGSNTETVDDDEVDNNDFTEKFLKTFDIVI